MPFTSKKEHKRLLRRANLSNDAIDAIMNVKKRPVKIQPLTTKDEHKGLLEQIGLSPDAVGTILHAKKKSRRRSATKVPGKVVPFAHKKDDNLSRVANG